VDCQICYNSLAHPPSSIAYQCLGANPAVLETIFSSIQQMWFFLHTTHGDSTTFYGGPPTNSLPFQGVCQGNGAGPALWLATSIPLLELVQHHGYISSFVCLVSRHSILLIRLFYVDDCDLFVFLPSADQAMAAIQALQTNVILWHSTGGSLSLKKCSWSVLSYQH